MEVLDLFNIYGLRLIWAVTATQNKILYLIKFYNNETNWVYVFGLLFYLYNIKYWDSIW